MGDKGYLHGEHRLIDNRVMHEPSHSRTADDGVSRRRAQGTVVNRLTTNVDVAPTFREWAGVQVPAEFQGRSLVPFLRGETPQWRNEFA